MTDAPQQPPAAEPPIFRDPGEPPDLDWLDPELIDIDARYQRALDPDRVWKIVTWFSWDSFGALAVARKADGRFNCIDGQHRLAAAKQHPFVNLVPAVITHADGLAAEAEGFVAVNADRRNVSQLDLFWAQLAAGDPEAQTAEMVMRDAGIVIVRHPKPRYIEGETVAISAIKGIVDRHGRMRARQILEVLGKAKLAPITGMQIKAAEILLTDAEFKDEVEPDALAEAIAGKVAQIEAEAALFATGHKVAKAKAYASIWFKRTRKRRKAA